MRVYHIFEPVVKFPNANIWFRWFLSFLIICKGSLWFRIKFEFWPFNLGAAFSIVQKIMLLFSFFFFDEINVVGRHWNFKLMSVLAAYQHARVIWNDFNMLPIVLEWFSYSIAHYENCQRSGTLTNIFSMSNLNRLDLNPPRRLKMHNYLANMWDCGPL